MNILSQLIIGVKKIMKIVEFFVKSLKEERCKPILDKNRKALFILKKRQNYDDPNFAMTLVTGMFNSVNFIANMLNQSGIESKVVVVVDNNSIDREVAEFRPTDVFIEGMWVVEDKFDILKKLHPTVNWVVRCHSEIPFLAHEGFALQRAFGYAKRGISMSGNSIRVNNSFKSIIGDSLQMTELAKLSKFPYLPNYYPYVHFPGEQDVINFKHKHKDTLDIGCFGAIRPLKNQLIQAVAAVEMAKHMRKKLNFHINVGRVEGNASGQLRNLQTLFNELGEDYKLIEHGWMDHTEFCALLKSMDLCMQISFSETFNIVTADAISQYVPVIVSPEISWISNACYADTTDVDGIVKTMEYVLYEGYALVYYNVTKLNAYTNKAKDTWLNYFSR